MLFLSGSIHKTFTWQSQTVLGHFSDGHFAVTSQTSLHLVQKTVCVFVKRKCGLNEDLYDSEQFTYNVLCQLLPYNDITALLVAHELLSAVSSNCFRTETDSLLTPNSELIISTLGWQVWDVFNYIVFSTVEHKKKKIIFFNTISRGFGFLVFKQKKQSDRKINNLPIYQKSSVISSWYSGS